MEEQMSFFNKVLVIDLSTRSHRYEDLDRSVLESYIGGYGLGAWYTFTKQNGSGIDPLGPENILSFCPGLLNRTGASFGGRFMVTAKSPLTGGWGDANCGGKFGPALKACGLDLLAIHGVADKPVMVIVGDDRVEIRDAEELWGKDAVETEEVLKEQLGTKYEIASIGTGGEKLIKFAGIVTDKGRIAARSGVGAVMGSKRLKPIAVKGSKNRRSRRVTSSKSSPRDTTRASERTPPSTSSTTCSFSASPGSRRSCACCLSSFATRRFSSSTSSCATVRPGSPRFPQRPATRR